MNRTCFRQFGAPWIGQIQSQVGHFLQEVTSRNKFNMQEDQNHGRSEGKVRVQTYILEEVAYMARGPWKKAKPLPIH